MARPRATSATVPPASPAPRPHHRPATADAAICAVQTRVQDRRTIRLPPARLPATRVGRPVVSIRGRPGVVLYRAARVPSTNRRPPIDHRRRAPVSLPPPAAAPISIYNSPARRRGAAPRPGPAADRSWRRQRRRRRRGKRLRVFRTDKVSMVNAAGAGAGVGMVAAAPAIFLPAACVALPSTDWTRRDATRLADQD